MNALQVFEPGAQTVYTIEAAAQLAQVPRRLIVLYYKHGLVSPVADPAGAAGISTTRRSESFAASSTCGLLAA